MHRERLERLKFLLQNLETELPEVKVFNMCSTVDRYSYGIMADALGSAALWPEFNEQGLQVSDDDDVEFDNLRDAEAAEEFFKLAPPLVDYLFYPYDYGDICPITPQHVVARIDEILTS